MTRELRSETAANQALQGSPADRAMWAAWHGRTAARAWDGASYGAAVTRMRRRARLIDRLFWLGSGALILGTLYLAVWR